MQRLPVRRDVTRLKAIHRRRVERDGAAEQAPEFDPSHLSMQVQKLAVQGFRQLLETEHESVVIAGWMCAGLQRIGAPLDIVGAFGKVVEDEIRHVDIIAQLLEGFGQSPDVPCAPLPPPVESIQGAAAIEEILAGMASFFCVGEELSGHIFKAAVQLSREPRMHWATSEIFRDEATHGAIGFETAAELVRLLDAPARQRVGLRMQASIAAFEKRLGGPLVGVKDAFDEDEKTLASLGLLPRQALLKIFYEQVERNLVPRLAELGIYSENNLR